jgi:hypothetical protein
MAVKQPCSVGRFDVLWEALTRYFRINLLNLVKVDDIRNTDRLIYVTLWSCLTGSRSCLRVDEAAQRGCT